MSDKIKCGDFVEFIPELFPINQIAAKNKNIFINKSYKVVRMTKEYTTIIMEDANEGTFYSHRFSRVSMDDLKPNDRIKYVGDREAYQGQRGKITTKGTYHNNDGVPVADIEWFGYKGKLKSTLPTKEIAKDPLPPKSDKRDSYILKEKEHPVPEAYNWL